MWSKYKENTKYKVQSSGYLTKEKEEVGLRGVAQSLQWQ